MRNNGTFPQLLIQQPSTEEVESLNNYFVLIIDDELDHINKQILALTEKIGFNSKNIKVFCLREDERYQQEIEGLKQKVGEVVLFDTIKDLVEKIKNIDPTHKLHILLDMDMSSKDTEEHKQNFKEELKHGAYILGLIVKDEKLKKAMQDGNLGITITSGCNIGEIFPQNFVIDLENGESVMIAVEERNVKFIFDGAEVNVYKAVENKISTASAQAIKGILNDERRKDMKKKFPHMLPLADFLGEAGINYERINSTRSSSTSRSSESIPSLSPSRAPDAVNESLVGNIKDLSI